MGISIREINSIARDMKYEALYWALGFIEYKNGIFEKQYNNFKATIFADKQYVDYADKLAVVNGIYLPLKTHKSFVILECIDKLLRMGYLSSQIVVDLDNEYDIYCDNLYIKCYEWGKLERDDVSYNKKYIKSVRYSSRLVSGIIEREYYVKDNSGKEYNYGIFENEKKCDYELSIQNEKEVGDFVVKGETAVKYLGTKAKVIIPNGIKIISSGLFWDNQAITEVVIPDTVEEIGGDAFYNCSNLISVNIPSNVKSMGNNPFAGCPNLILRNDSQFFHYENGALYNNDYSKIIYYSIENGKNEYVINDKTLIVGKHSFYLCKDIKKIVIPSSTIKLENNPFSGCEKLELVNNSSKYHVKDKVIYDEEYQSVVGCINSIDTDELVLENVKRICRNSFWNCKGIRRIVLPKTLSKIGYNPFVGCDNIEFESNTDSYIVYNNALFSANLDTLICYPAKYAVGEVHLPDQTITLERGSFSGCRFMTNISLHNVAIISKTCFTNCDSLTNVYCSDLVKYIGEWAFSHCKNLKEISIFKDCIVDKNATLNSNAIITARNKRSNYVIESDNIYTLKAMTKSYLGIIDSIIIDPPYNSNIDYIKYKDNYSRNEYEKFIESRLLYSEKLLSPHGFVVINTDKGEVKNIAKICKSIFKDNVSIHKWEKLHPFFDINRNVPPNKKRIKYEYIIICSKSKKARLKTVMQPYLVDNTLIEKEKNVPHIFKCYGTNSSAKDEIKNIFGDRNYFSTPKPLKLVKELIRATSKKDSIILDFFAGSGTTGHATIELNREDNGNRNYILISNNESNICRDVTLKRMKKCDSDVVFLS